MGSLMTNTTPGASFLSVRQVTEILSVSAEVVRALIASGILVASDVATSPGKRRWRIAAADLQAFLDSRKNVAPTARPRRRISTGHAPKYY